MASTLSNRDLEIVQKAFQCFKSPDAMKLDYDKLATLAGFSNGRSANASWCIIKKKLMAGPNGDSDNAGANAEDDSTPKAKSAPKKANSKAKTVKNVEAPVDSTDTPTTSPAKKAGGKRKAAVFDDAEKGDEANGESAQKPKRKYIRKPKAADAPPAKRGKKGTKAGAETSEEESKVHVKAGSEELDQSAVLDDIIKHEEQNDEDQPFTAEEQEYVNGQLADDAILGAHANDDGIAL